ncbi:MULTISPECIES: hypothetical protein [unclassified Coleofasciculus]|uniref:hypothetical protein n=1 Tax=unclassified Coleofasciculus TaxID=2692782 RepID=UPI0018812571|nr:MULTISPECIES: hypothetical protein [unclassified Coleofasciculus]MBE9125298.1 hypothetical protein [Coleofasciculus sp. LEGE 07081]MBE9147079.1 hypothetical protein [Coleofasciculus sp. LEGE 07092]
MAYSDFTTLEKVIKPFDLTLSDQLNLFSNVAELEPSNFLKEIIEYNLPLALASNTKKARSEMIIAPIFIELRKQFKQQISLFSGIDFNIDYERGLNGHCDFVISRSSELLIVTTPVVIIVEAKKENINGGLGQCVAEMLAAKLFNEREGNEIQAIYGTVTTGTNWRFLKLVGQVIEVDLGEYFLVNLNKILGILASGITQSMLSN